MTERDFRKEYGSPETGYTISHTRYRELLDEIDRLREQAKAVKFIDHIANHLEPGQFVVCKICGKSAMEIMLEDQEPEGGGEE